MVRTLAHVDTARNRLFLSGLPVTEDFCTIALTITLNLVHPLLSESGRKLSKLMTIDRRFVFRVACLFVSDGGKDVSVRRPGEWPVPQRSSLTMRQPKRQQQPQSRTEKERDFVRQALVGCVFEKGNENRNYRFHHGNFESGSSWKTEWKVQSSLVLVLFCNNVQVWCS